MAATSTTKASASVPLKEYLKRYENPSEDEKNKKKKKKKKRPSKHDSIPAVRVVDEDPIWQKPINLEEEEEEDSADEEKPQIDEDIEVKRMKRLEAIRSQRPYHAISDDGSGWVSVSDAPRQSNSESLSPLRSGWSRLDGQRGEVADLSPPRQQRARFDTPSPEPGPHTSNSIRSGRDLSPPRRSHPPTSSPDVERGNLERHESPDFSPPRDCRLSAETNPQAAGRHDSQDLSPPRRSRPHMVSSGSIARSNSSDLSPPRRSRPPTAPSDLKRKNSEIPDSQDLSPPRRGRRHSPKADPSHASSAPDLSPPRQGKDSFSVKEGSRAGLFSKEDFKEETDRKRKELSGFSKMDLSESGRGAEPVYRDKQSGKRLSKDEFLKLQQPEEKPKEKKLEWGKGLAQKREAEARERDLELERDKPFARTRDDPELDKMLKERIRWGDPMAHLVKRKQSELVLEDLGDDEKMKESGFMIPQTIPSHSWIKRGIDAAPNRYGIRPGRHWDGVDRSSGYEKELFKRQNEKQATEREAYLWSVSDM